jgi:DNA (cytosine-5)-methyltransferase 1
MKITHYDLFAGIGGFSYAVDQVYGKENTKHIFVENNQFATAVLKKHWPEGEYWGDIREFIAHTRSEEQRGLSDSERKEISSIGERFILTGGFPCQPFSQAGKRHGTQDNRYLWPEMFRVIQLVKPQIVVAENVYGILTIEGGLVFEQVCSDLEAEGYEVQPLVIPAVAVNAPHRRDRVWIVAHRKSGREWGDEQERSGTRQPEAEVRNRDSNALDTQSRQSRKQTKQKRRESFNRRDWERDWKEVAFATCNDRVDDGLSKRMVRLPDGTKISYAKWRQEGLKAFGNAIVPPLAIQILKGIKYVEDKFAEHL